MVVQVKFLGFLLFCLLLSRELVLGGLGVSVDMGVCVGVSVLGGMGLGVGVGACCRSIVGVDPPSSISPLVDPVVSTDVVPHCDIVRRKVVILEQSGAAYLCMAGIRDSSHVSTASDIVVGVSVSLVSPSVTSCSASVTAKSS